MKLRLTILFLSGFHVVFAQQNSVWFEPGTSWTYNWNASMDPDQSDFIYTYSVTETGIHLGKYCSKIEPEDSQFSCLSEPAPYYMYHSNDTVYYATQQMTEFAIGYVLSEGAYWEYQTSVNDTVVRFAATVQEISTVFIDGVELESYTVLYQEITDLGYVSVFPQERTVVSVLGDLNMFIIPFGMLGNCDIESAITLRCFSSPSFDYENPDFTSCSLGIGDIERGEQNLFRPNPANEAIYWDDDIEALTIYDMTGKRVMHTTGLSGIQFQSVEGLASGFYTVVMEKDNTFYSRKLVVR